MTYCICGQEIPAPPLTPEAEVRCRHCNAPWRYGVGPRVDPDWLREQWARLRRAAQALGGRGHDDVNP